LLYKNGECFRNQAHNDRDRKSNSASWSETGDENKWEVLNLGLLHLSVLVRKLCSEATVRLVQRASGIQNNMKQAGHKAI